jgi:homoserine dehydrogenase
MFYGKGAGKLPTASAVVADIIDIVAHRGKEGVPAPKFAVATDADYADFSASTCRSCFAFADSADAADKIRAVFGEVDTVKVGDRIAFIGAEMTEKETEAKIAACGAALVSRIRML